MSVLIKECAERLAVKFDNIASTQGKLDAKMYLELTAYSGKLFNL